MLTKTWSQLQQVPVITLLSPSDAYMEQCIVSALDQVTAFWLFSAKPLPDLMPTSCELDP